VAGSETMEIDPVVKISPVSMGKEMASVVHSRIID
jgi:hypothetical protein